jgi:hypothetical protein
MGCARFCGRRIRAEAGGIERMAENHRFEARTRIAICAGKSWGFCYRQMAVAQGGMVR